MIEAAMIWNKPNDPSHWDAQLDPAWQRFAALTQLAAQAIRAERTHLPRVLAGVSPIDVGFIANLAAQGVLADVEVVAVHGFPLDWHPWQIDEWPRKVAMIRATTRTPVWVTETGVSSFGADEVQAWGLDRTAELLIGRVPRIHWCSLYDASKTQQDAAQRRDSSHFRRYRMGLLREDGTPKCACESFAQYTPALGICQGFGYEDQRLDDAVAWLKRLGVRHLRTGLSWADSFRPNAIEWFDRQMQALEDFKVTVTFCGTPAHLGLTPHPASPPRNPEKFAEFCARMIARYAPQLSEVTDRAREPLPTIASRSAAH